MKIWSYLRTYPGYPGSINIHDMANINITKGCKQENKSISTLKNSWPSAVGGPAQALYARSTASATWSLGNVEDGIAQSCKRRFSEGMGAIRIVSNCA